MPVLTQHEMENHLPDVHIAPLALPVGFDVFFQAARDLAAEFPKLRKITPATDEMHVILEPLTNTPLAWAVLVDKKWYVSGGETPAIKPNPTQLITRALRQACGHG